MKTIRPPLFLCLTSLPETPFFRMDDLGQQFQANLSFTTD